MADIIFLVFCCCYSAVQLLPPSCFEATPTDPLAALNETVNNIVTMLDDYNHLTYVQMSVLCVANMKCIGYILRLCSGNCAYVKVHAC